MLICSLCVPCRRDCCQPVNPQPCPAQASSHGRELRAQAIYLFYFCEIRTCFIWWSVTTGEKKGNHHLLHRLPSGVSCSSVSLLVHMCISLTWWRCVLRRFFSRVRIASLWGSGVVLGLQLRNGRWLILSVHRPSACQAARGRVSVKWHSRFWPVLFSLNCRCKRVLRAAGFKMSEPVWLWSTWYTAGLKWGRAVRRLTPLI